MLHVLAVDDEVPALEELAYLLREDPRIAQVTAAAEAAEALRNLSRMLVAGQRVDAIFLDIRMPGLDGLDFSRLLMQFAAPPVVVFVTAHEDCAVSAYELGALDYLLKPVRPQRLAEAVRRVQVAVHRKDEGLPPDEPDVDEVIPVELGGRTRMVMRSTVLYVEAHGDYVRLHTGEGEHLIRMPLAVLANRWEPAGFIRIHRSSLVAAGHITELNFEAGRATVQVGDHLLAVSRRHTREVRDLLVRKFRFDPRPRPDSPVPQTSRPQPLSAEPGIRPAVPGLSAPESFGRGSRSGGPRAAAPPPPEEQ